MGSRHPRQALERVVVENLAVFDDTAMPVARIFVDANIGDDHEPRHVVFYRLDGPLDNAVRIVAGTAPLVFLGRNAEQNDRGNAQPMNVPGLFDQQIDRQPVLTRHRGDFFPPVPPLDDEQRVNEIARRQGRFPHHPPERFVLA